jgi:hypothetical protein
MEHMLRKNIHKSKITSAMLAFVVNILRKFAKPE